MPTRKPVQSTQPPQRPILDRLNQFLSIGFYAIWILIGLFLLFLIVQGQRRGAFVGLLSGKVPQSQDSSQVPTETDLPGIGRVNVACVQKALKSESIQRLLSEGNANFLQGDEKTSFEACIISRESPSPSAVTK